ncbi:hypothetical protein KXQ82_18820 [Mucilaginibacter sp. HMF5004]|uniref:hypothetical protein n=1 Tax=Mucilaginibacter rivuli TaxID=2857527 RepID=UPI001C5D2A3A|nr:hypothetical protein [Mucilaginibacter rivuli]MBW4891786.1 hypothetical protein [Mucilaginibacter rivuli]
MFKIKEDIISALAYFDMFDYPLMGREIYLFLKNRYPQYQFDDTLQCLVLNELVYRFDKFYSLKNDPLLITRRVNSNKKAIEMMNFAGKLSNVLIKFPYIRGIAVSGALSKNFINGDKDIQLFIITAKNRLWIARSLISIIKKLRFFGAKQNHFCTHYYIDEEQLEVPEKTLYTAIEIVTLIPLHGDALFERFYTANTWTGEYLPNKIMRLSSAKPVKSSFIKSAFEMIFDNPLGNAIDALLMKLITKGQQSKALANKHCFMPDTKGFQTKLLLKHETRVFDILHPIAAGARH